jgi:DNA-binding beta-propeller fold protein YncE
LTRLDAATGAVRDTVSTAMWPYDVAIDGARDLAFTAGLDVGRVDVIDLDAFSVTSEYALPTRPIRVALDQDGARLFATTLSDLKLVALDAETGAIEAGARDIGGIGNGLVLTPDGTRLWVTTTNGRIHRVNPATLAIEQTFTPGGVPQDIVVDAAGSHAYVAHEDGWVSVLDAGTGARLDSIPAASPFGLALEPGGDRLWVAAARRGEVVVLDLGTGRIVGGFIVGGAPRTIAFDGAGRAFIANEFGLVHVATPDP